MIVETYYGITHHNILHAAWFLVITRWMLPLVFFVVKDIIYTNPQHRWAGKRGCGFVREGRGEHKAKIAPLRF